MNKQISPEGSIDTYIYTFPIAVQERLNRVREIILENAPTAVESISYGMPAYKLNGKPLVYFAGYQKHIGFYATPQAHLQFTKDLAQFKQGKGSVQFPLTQELPEELIRRIVIFKRDLNLGHE